MIKKLLLALAVAIPACAWAQAPKFGTVDANAIMQDMPEMKTIESQVAEKRSSRHEFPGCEIPY